VLNWLGFYPQQFMQELRLFARGRLASAIVPTRRESAERLQGVQLLEPSETAPNCGRAVLRRRPNVVPDATILLPGWRSGEH